MALDLDNLRRAAGMAFHASDPWSKAVLERAYVAAPEAVARAVAGDDGLDPAVLRQLREHPTLDSLLLDGGGVLSLMPFVVPVDVEVAPAAPPAGTAVTVTWTEQNHGGASGALGSLVLLHDAEGNEVVRQALAHDPLDAAAARSLTAVVAAPATAGTYQGSVVANEAGAPSGQTPTIAVGPQGYASFVLDVGPADGSGLAADEAFSASVSIDLDAPEATGDYAGDVQLTMTPGATAPVAGVAAPAAADDGVLAYRVDDEGLDDLDEDVDVVDTDAASGYRAGSTDAATGYTLSVPPPRTPYTDTVPTSASVEGDEDPDAADDADGLSQEERRWLDEDFVPKLDEESPFNQGA